MANPEIDHQATVLRKHSDIAMLIRGFHQCSAIRARRRPSYKVHTGSIECRMQAARLSRRRGFMFRVPMLP
ncbi:hypothetical protein CC1G_13762 [Coprinopsis cinerea okayama7|uniref:Uncharacterized protein n=1 Tax=Coprinopsis cinerea (strain Okayama-7 / 130 / ATCC MYA-4618 / FGSC 9003) TaxID=240176 RepID=D6RKA9_COPC7|nr:hypothetical protein CC1G_13762 [Coprinopsis cinerea okayama7\|eukprot:XP_002912230.1 hypothetical protein CC1G_13762 [Coprinopsis cinerea okayama7\